MSSRFSQEAMEVPLHLRSALVGKTLGRKLTPSNGKFCPHIPFRVILEMEAKRATHAYTLVMLLHQQMTLREVSSLMLTGEVWEQLGDVDPSRRQVMLRNLRKVPKVFALKTSRSYHHYYRVSRGPLWSQRGKSDA